MPRYQYGGQALIEGVLMRGRSALAVALRHPDGSIVWATERLDLGLRARRALKMPFLRGLVLLYDTLVTGTRWLVRSATLQALEEGAEGGSGPAGGQGAVNGALGSAMSVLRTAVLAPMAPVLGAASDGPYSDPDATASGPAAATDRPGPSASRADKDPAGEARAGEGVGKGYAVAVGGMLLLSLVLGIGIFFLLPLLLAQATVGRVDHGFGLQLAEGGIRIVIFIGYLLLVGRAADVRRTFQYHGAEHMSIHTLEGGDPLTVEAARKYPTAHPRCGTEFLVVVLLVSILAFAVIGSLPPLMLVASRVLLVPVIAAVSYEILQLGARHRSHTLVRWLWSPGIWVQMITTRQPTDDMIEVAIVSLQRALLADGAEIPAGSADFHSRPLNPADAEANPSGLPLAVPSELLGSGAELARD
ncbi:MAG TPA: DUF1385 domain-containing protein [Terriglobales bacterium]|nr:DUF1385 domain-containing protein [Terriglobales bacterium]